MDVSRLLLTFHSRLEQTEAQLAMNLLPDRSQGMAFDPLPNSADISSLDFMDMQQPPQQVLPQAVTQPDMGYLDNLDIDEQILRSDIDAW